MALRRILVSMFALMFLLAPATPVAAHHKDGHGGGPNGHAGVQRHDGGNSEAAHECKEDVGPHGGDGFRNRGECVSEAAHEKNEDKDGGDDNDELEDAFEEFCDELKGEDLDDEKLEDAIEELCD